MGVDEQGPHARVELAADGLDVLGEQPARVEGRRHRVVGAREDGQVEWQVAQRLVAVALERSRGLGLPGGTPRRQDEPDGDGRQQRPDHTRQEGDPARPLSGPPVGAPAPGALDRHRRRRRPDQPEQLGHPEVDEVHARRQHRHRGPQVGVAHDDQAAGDGDDPEGDGSGGGLAAPGRPRGHGPRQRSRRDAGAPAEGGRGGGHDEAVAGGPEPEHPQVRHRPPHGRAHGGGQLLVGDGRTHEPLGDHHQGADGQAGADDHPPGTGHRPATVAHEGDGEGGGHARRWRSPRRTWFR